ncbi:MAG TPA: DUF3750 domain-containing protein [Gammaproteobacteria bacterium]
MNRRQRRRALLLLLALLLGGPLVGVASGDVQLRNDWRTADRSPTGLAPDPGLHPEAVIQAYAARAFNWRGLLAVHTWLATKAAGADHYTVHQVVGWRRGNGRSVVRSYADQPDRRWYGAEPELLLDLRGARAAALIPRLEAAVAAYPHATEYTLWPGPNSNTFVAYVGRAVPELGLELPVTAIGKDYLEGGALAGPLPSGSGYQLSLFGLAGVGLGLREGLEVNLLGLAFGLDLDPPALKLPGIGRLGFAARPERGG